MQKISGEVWEKDECRSKKAEEVRHGKRKDFRRGELLWKDTVKMLYEWNNKKFEKEYLKKVRRRIETDGRKDRIR